MINNVISEDYCSFEVSKLLKEKGLIRNVPNPKNAYYQKKNGKWLYPTHSLAIKWIRENFGIHIFTDFGIGWGAYIIPVGYMGTGKLPSPIEKFSSPEEATEAALEYTLKNLI